MKKHALAALALFLPVIPAQAAYSVDTGTPTGEASYSIFNNSSSSFQSLAGQFSLGATTTVATIDGYITATTAAEMGIALYANAITPGNLVLSQSFTADAGEGWKGISFGAIDLSAGTYWVTFSVVQGQPEVNMHDDAPSPLPDYAFINHLSSGQWISLNYINIGVRVGDGVAAVPEPASWAMMIGGMALAGAALRRRTAMRISFA